MIGPPVSRLLEIFKRLERAFGYQGWWPLLSRAEQEGYNGEGYRNGPDVVGPVENDERFEIAVGALLTQNTSWENARAALMNLRGHGALTVAGLRLMEVARVAALVHSSGYFNQKAKKIKLLADGWEVLMTTSKNPITMRERLLATWGIGPETADSILLYAFGEPFFVVDAYTERIFERVGLLTASADYEQIQAMCHRYLPREPGLFGEFHALLVRLGRNYCRRVGPDCSSCPLVPVCSSGGEHRRPEVHPAAEINSADRPSRRSSSRYRTS